MGGDRAPEEIVAGALEAQADGIEPILFGPEGSTPTGCNWSRRRQDRDGRQARGRGALEAGQLARRGEPRRRAGDADAVVSAGNTGAMLAAGLLEIRRLQGSCGRRSRS
jgi:glycerol-3-phosphate acyltransferase PlsX